MNDLTQQQPDGTTLPRIPGIEDMFKNLGMAGFSDLGKTPAAVGKSESQAKKEELGKSYARIFGGNGTTTDAETVLNDILDQTLRRSPGPPHIAGKGLNIEQTALYVAERTGQNGMALYIMTMIDKGRNAGSGKPAKKKK